MAAGYTLYRNTYDGDLSYVDSFGTLPPITSVVDDEMGETYDWSRTGYNFLGWNTARDGSGTMYQPGASPAGGSYYAQWQEIVVTPDVTISYNNSTIATMSASGTEILETDGTYMADDITIEYTKPTPSLQNKTVSPTTSSQSVTADSGYDGLGTVTVSAISPTKSAQTYTPTTSNQTIASGRWLTGTQTILGDANLISANIAEGVTIFGVTGTHSGGGGYAICIMRDLYDRSYHSITTDGTYGESVTTKETRANAGDYVYLARASDLSPSIYTTETGTEVQRTYYDEFEISTRGGGTPPGPPGGNTYIVWRITMPASDIYIAA